MGNCLRHESESDMTWGGDDWGSPLSEKLITKDTKRGERKREESQPDEILLSFREKKKEKDKRGVVSSGVAVTEVKIKITKKQLEELLGKVDDQRLSVKQVLAQLMSVGDTYHEAHQRSWRPALQTIPE